MSNRSTGPRSGASRPVSSRATLKTGIYAKAEVILGHEDPEELEALTATYYERFAPTTPEQRCLVDSLIGDEWLLRRFRVIEAQVISRAANAPTAGDGGTPNRRTERTLESLRRRVKATRGNYEATLEILARLQSAPAAPEVEWPPMATRFVQ